MSRRILMTFPGLIPALALLVITGQAMAQMPTAEQMQEMNRAMQQYNSPEMQAQIAAAQEKMRSVDTCQNMEGAGLLLPHQKPDPATGRLVTGNCAAHPKFKAFCAKVQEDPGTFASLHDDEVKAGGLLPRSTGKAGAPTAQQLQRAPLTEVMRACGLATDDASYRKLQSRLAATAMAAAARVNVEEEVPPGGERASAWWFALRFATDEYYDKAAALAKQECQGANGHWGSRTKMHFRFCDQLGDALDGFDTSQRGRLLRYVGCAKGMESAARGTCIGAAGSTDAGPPAKAAPASGSAEPQEQAEQKKDSDKAKDALRKGKDKLRGLFGG